MEQDNYVKEENYHPSISRAGNFFRSAVLYTAIAAYTALSVLGCDNGGGGNNNPLPTKPTAGISASPNPGRKSLDNIVFDASGSVPASGTQLKSVSIDYDGDGFEDYFDDDSDGTLDMSVSNVPLSAGDFQASATVTNDLGESDTAYVDVDVGFGDDEAGAMVYAQDILEGWSYECTPNTQYQLFDPVVGKVVSYDSLKADNGSEVLHVLWYNALSLEQRDAIDNCVAEGVDISDIRLIFEDDSPDTIVDNL